MDLNYIITQMSSQAETIRSLAQGLTAEQARRRPDPGAWSVLEVINHLYDEEREDFRTRLDICLNRPDEPWPPIDPAGWVTARDYNSRDLSQSIDGFLSEREASLQWLRELSSPDWEAVVQAPFGQIRSGDVLAAWVAHDLLHTRQLVELRWTLNLHSVEPFKVNYAGDW